MASGIALLVRLAARVFYRRVETVGFERIPATGPVLLVANHVNGLVDPMLALATLPRPVVFVAKSTLWRVPVLRFVLDALAVVPVVRRVDVEREGEPGGPGRNDESLERLAGVLNAGGAVLIFPEGRSHSDPGLSPLRSGAARLVRLAGGAIPVLPLGFWYVRKEEFRSDVLLSIGRAVTPDAGGTVEDWTKAIREGLLGVTLDADDWSRHEAVEAADVLWAASVVPGDDLETRGAVRRALLDAWRDLERTDGPELARLARRARVLARVLERFGLAPGDLDREAPLSIAPLAGRAGAILLGLPIWLVGAATFWIPYRLTAVAARRAPAPLRERDQISLVKILAGGLLHLASLAAVAFGAYRLGGPFAAAGAAFLLPAAGLFAVGWVEDAAALGRRAGLVFRLALSRGRLEPLRRERDEIRTALEALQARWRGAGRHNPGE